MHPASPLSTTAVFNPLLTTQINREEEVLPSSSSLEVTPVVTIISPVSSSQPTIAVFFPPQLDFFSGREEFISRLQQLLEQNGCVVLIPEEEIPCQIGKSSLASFYARKEPFAYWIPAKNKKVLQESYQQLAKALQIEPSQLKEHLGEQSHLIVFDGVQDVQGLQEFLPKGKCRVLITSRQKNWQHPLLEIGAFPPSEAAQFLCQYTGKSDPTQVGIKIAESLDCLPTSLAQAGHLIIEHQAELEGYFSLQEALLEEKSQTLKKVGNLGQRNRNFTGREMALVALEEALKTHMRAVITAKRKVAAEVGLGGMGKTQIALQYAVRNAEKYPFLVWRVNCESETSLLLSYGELAEKLGIYLTEEEKKEANALIKRVNRRLEQESGWLLIYDDAEKQKDLEGLIPKTGGHVLITSRNPDWEGSFAQVFKVGVFKRKESIALIQKMTTLSVQEADQLAELVKDLPIAVAQAAAYIQQTQISYAEYDRCFNDIKQRLFPHQTPTDEFSKTINITWQVSMDKIAEREKAKAETLKTPYPVAGPLMNFCAFLAPTDIPRSLLLLPWMKKVFGREEMALADLDRTLELLRDFSMIELGEENISVHTLVQIVTRDKLSDDEQKRAFEEGLEVLTSEQNEFNEENVETWKRVKPCMPHALSLFMQQKLMALIELKKQYAFISQLGLVYVLIGDANSALEINQACVVVSEKWHNENPDSEKAKNAMATSYNHLGENLGVIGKDIEALELNNKALKLKLGLSKKNYPSIAKIHNTIGLTLRCLSRTTEALTHYQEALRIQIDFYGESHIQTAKTYNLIGQVLEDQGKSEKALKYNQEALKIQKEFYRENHPDLAMSYSYIGLNLDSLDKSLEAIDFHRKALEIECVHYGENHPFIALNYNNIGVAFLNLGNAEEALKYHEKALKIQLDSYGPSHPDVAQTYNNRGAFYYKLGKYIEALNDYHKALEIWSSCYGELHDNIARVHINIGEVYAILNETDKAVVSFQKGFEMIFSLYKTNYPNTISSHGNIRPISQNIGKLNKTLDSLLKSLNLYIDTYGENRFIVATFCDKIGTTLQALERDNEALDFFQKALKIWIDLYSEKNLTVSAFYNKVGNVLLNLGRAHDALDNLQKALNIRLAIQGENHVDVAVLYNNMGETFQYLERMVEALDFYQKALNIMLPLVGSEDPSVKIIQSNILEVQQLSFLYQFFPRLFSSNVHTVSFPCLENTHQSLIYDLPSRRGVLKVRKKEVSKTGSFLEHTFLHAIDCLYSNLPLPKTHKTESQFLIQFLQNLAQQETFVFQGLFQEKITPIYQRTHQQLAKNILDLSENPASRAILQELGGHEKSYKSYFPAKDLELFINSHFETFSSYLFNDYLEKKSKIYLEFLKNIYEPIAFEDNDLSSDFLKELQITTQKWLNRKYGLKPSFWSPAQPIGELLKALREAGPLMVVGQFGKTFYEQPPIELQKKFSKKIQGWKFGTGRVMTPKTHTIIIVGAARKTSARGGGYVYFIDPYDRRDGNQLQNDIFYKISYQNLQTHTRRSELLPGYAVYLSKVESPIVEVQKHSKKN